MAKEFKKDPLKHEVRVNTLIGRLEISVANQQVNEEKNQLRNSARFYINRLTKEGFITEEGVAKWKKDPVKYYQEIKQEYDHIFSPDNKRRPGKGPNKGRW